MLFRSAGQFFTISGKDLECIADSSGKLTWQWRAVQPNQPGQSNQPSPQPQQPAVQPSSQPQQGSPQQNPGISATSAVTEVSSTYTALSSGTGTSLSSSAKPTSYLSALGIASTSGSARNNIANTTGPVCCSSCPCHD